MRRPVNFFLTNQQVILTKDENTIKIQFNCTWSKWLYFTFQSYLYLPYILADRMHHRIDRSISFVLKKFDLELTRA